MATVMHCRTLETEPPAVSAEWLERRWYAAHMRAEDMRVQCEILRGVLELAHANWRDAVGKLADLEALRDQLACQYGALPGQSHASRSPVNGGAPTR